MDSSGGDLNNAAREVGANMEKQLSRDSHQESVREKHERDPDSSGSSSDDIARLKEVDSHIVKISEVKDGDEAYAHLSPHEKEIVKRQLAIPEVNVTYKTLYRYATTNDLIIIFVSSICAIAGGAVMPLMTVSTLSSHLRSTQIAHEILGHLWSAGRHLSRLLPRRTIPIWVQCSIVTLYDLFHIPCGWRVCYHLYLYRWVHLHGRAYRWEDP